MKYRRPKTVVGRWHVTIGGVKHVTKYILDVANLTLFILSRVFVPPK